MRLWILNLKWQIIIIVIIIIIIIIISRSSNTFWPQNVASFHFIRFTIIKMDESFTQYDTQTNPKPLKNDILVWSMSSSANMEKAGFMTSTKASLQGAIMIIWSPSWESMMLYIRIDNIVDFDLIWKQFFPQISQTLLRFIIIHKPSLGSEQRNFISRFIRRWS